MYLCFSFTRRYCIPVFFFLKMKPTIFYSQLVPNRGFCIFKNANTSEDKIVKWAFIKNLRLVIDTGTNDIHILILWQACTAVTNNVTNLL